MPGFNYNGDGATGSGLSPQQQLEQARNENPGSSLSLVDGPTGLGIVGQLANGHILMQDVHGGSLSITGGANGSGGNGSTTSPVMTLHNGQMGYWEDRTTGAGNNEHTSRVFIAVGPSEAEKAAAAAKALQDKQLAEAAANAFAAKVTAAATAAAQGRDKAIADAAAYACCR